MPNLMQPTLFDMFDASALSQTLAVTDAVEQLASNSGIEVRGAFSTRVEVVEFILDLVGYTIDKPVYQQRILEPSFGNGDFLFMIIERLLTSWKSNPDKSLSIRAGLGGAIRAVELHRETFNSVRIAVSNA